LTSKELEVPLLPEVAPVKIIVWPVWALVMVILLMVAVPLVVVVEIGVAAASGLPKVMLMFSEASVPVVMLLLYWSWACMVTLKEVPAVCGELMIDTW